MIMGAQCLRPTACRGVYGRQDVGTTLGKRRNHRQRSGKEERMTHALHAMQCLVVNVVVVDAMVVEVVVVS